MTSDVATGFPIEQLPLPAALVAVNGAVLVWNKLFLELLGMTAADAAATTRSQLLASPLGADPNDSQSAESVYRFRKKDGSWIVAYLRRSMTAPSPSGVQTELFIFTDATAVATNQWELQLSHMRLKVLFEKADLPMMVVDQTLTIVNLNESYEKLSGYARSELIGRALYDVTDPERASVVAPTGESSAVVGQGSQVVECHLTKSGGAVFLKILSLMSWPDPDAGVCRVAILENVSSVQSVELQRRSIHEKQIAASKLAALSDMASGMAHEINNPLAIILGRSQQALRWVVRDQVDKERLTTALTAIEQGSHRIAKIIAGLMIFGRDAAGDRTEPREMQDIVNNTLIMCQERFRNNAVRLDVVMPLIPLAVECRSSQIAQSILTLLTNAFEAVQRLEERWISLTVADLGEMVELRVTDSGSGIDPDIGSRVFEPFFTTKTIGQGTGLGLSIARGIVESHKGQLRLDQTVANTCFVLTLFKRQSDVDLNVA